MGVDARTSPSASSFSLTKCASIGVDTQTSRLLLLSQVCASTVAVRSLPFNPLLHQGPPTPFCYHDLRWRQPCSLWWAAQCPLMHPSCQVGADAEGSAVQCGWSPAYVGSSARRLGCALCSSSNPLASDGHVLGGEGWKLQKPQPCRKASGATAMWQCAVIPELPHPLWAGVAQE